jgi:branched-chain amino acid transport system substrate-binding protein
MRTLGILAVSTALLAGCSLTTAGGLSECETSAECGENRVCTNNFCLPLPTGCGQQYPPPEENPPPDAVQIGAVLPLSLSATDPGVGKDESEVQVLNAIRLALGELNERGAGGKKITLHVCDTAADPVRTALQTQWLVNEKKIVALLTAGSSQTLAAAEVSLKNNVLTMSTSGTSPELAQVPDKNGGPVGLLWRTAPSDVIQGRIIADLLRNDTRFNSATKIGLIYLDDLYGQGLFDVITDRLKGSGKTFSGFLYSRKTESSIISAVTQLNVADPDLTVLVGFEDDATTILRFAAKSANLTTEAGHRWLFTDSAKDEGLLDDATVVAQVLNSYGTAPATNSGQAFSTFRSRFSAKYPGVDPTGYSFTSNAYDAMYLFGLAIAYSQGTSNEVTGPKMAEGLTKMSSGPRPLQLTSVNFTEASNELASGRSIDVEGASGTLQFDDTGEAPSPTELWQIRRDSATGAITFGFVENFAPPQ